MGLETGNYIEDLVDTNPVGATDPKSEGDDHIRLVKKCIQGSFPGGSGAWNFPTANPTFQDVSVRSLDVTSIIQTTPQVVIAAARVDGATGNFQGGEFGFQGTNVDRISAGTYEFTLAETNITEDDITVGVDVYYGLSFGTFSLGPAVPPAPGKFRLVTAVLSNQAPAVQDPVSWGIIVVNPRRNVS